MTDDQPCAPVTGGTSGIGPAVVSHRAACHLAAQPAAEHSENTKRRGTQGVG